MFIYNFFKNEWHCRTLPRCRSILENNSQTFGRKSEKRRVERAIIVAPPANVKRAIIGVPPTDVE